MVVQAIIDEMEKMRSNDDLTRRREELMVWSANNPRAELAKVALAAWVNCPVEKLPPSWHGHTCQATKDTWERVGIAVARHLGAEVK